MIVTTDLPGEPPVLWQWMNSRTHLPWSSDLRMLGLVRDDGTIAAAVGYNSWTENACWMHVAFDSAHSMTRNLLRAAWEYPFIKCGRSAVYGLTPKNNDEALAFNKRMGWRQIAETVDCLMFEMLHDECRWIKEKAHGREIVSTSST